MDILSLLAISLIICIVMMFMAWLAAIKLNFYSLVDPVWALGIGALVVTAAAISSNITMKSILGVAMASLWALRLGIHLSIRLIRHFPEEDSRYHYLKSIWKERDFFWFYQFQAISQMIFSLPLLLLIADPEPELNLLNYGGFLLFLVAWIGEGVADRQLSDFRKDIANKGQVCNVGLWKYSRHPNYFFEWLVWCGIALCAIQSPWGFLGVISPIAMFVTLNYFTGVPAAEKQSLKSKGPLYAAYQQRTNRFFLGPSK